VDKIVDTYEYTFVKNKTLKLTGVDLNCYKGPQMQRRLQTFLRRKGHSTWPAFFRAIQSDAEKLSEFRDFLTINVSYFFRDAEKWKCLQELVLPELLRGHPKLRVWSAGCSRGHEPYSLAMLLIEATNFYRPHQILATDIDSSALEWAQAGGPYSADEVAHVPSAMLDSYFVQDNGYWVNRRLQRKITFRQHNLLAEPFNPSDTAGDRYDLIVCRNVVIYFTAEVKEKLYRRFYQALRPGGILFVGGTEIIPKAPDMGFEAVSMSFYRRNDALQDSRSKGQGRPIPT
jgi:chemotaxis protein methyltransferase CheR